MSSATYDGTNGGAGGKFRKRPFRKSQTTPYDRPPTALRPSQNLNNNNNGGSNGWLSMIVDPASKFITSGAHKLFASVFRKRLLPPPPAPEPQPQPQRAEDEGKEMDRVQPELETNVVTSDVKVPVEYGGNNSMPSDSNGVAELECMLKQKTFTRSEIDHLTALLLSRTIENPDGVEKGSSEPKPSVLQTVNARHDKLSTPEVRSKVLSDEVASPAEIAKAYMGSRPSKLSPSVLRLQNHVPKEDLSTPSNQPPKSFSSVMSLTQKPVSNTVTTTNGFTSPRFRGRSAMYSMARTPYSRVHPATTDKSAETHYTTGGGSSYLNATKNNLSNKQVLKRRSSVLENDIGSVGPIRRIRQKPNLLHPKTLSLPPPGSRHVTHVSGLLSDVAEAPSSMEQTSQNRSFLKMLAENSLPSTSSDYVPSQSIEMAQKIFEHLDKYSPKGNVGKNVDISGGRSPRKTPAIESQDSLKPLQSSHDTKKIVGSKDSVHVSNHQFQTSAMMEEVSGKNLVSTSNHLGPQDSAVGTKAGSYLSSNSKAAEYMMPVPIVERPQKRAFQMSAHEDFLELDDDLPSNQVTLSTPLTERTQNAESHRKSVSISIPNILPLDQVAVVEEPPVKETTAHQGISQPESLANGSTVSDATVSCPPAVSLSSPASNMTLPGAISPQPIVELDKHTPQNDASGFFAAPSSKSDNMPSFVCNFPPAAKDTKLENPISAKRTAAEANGSDMTDSKSTAVFGNTTVKSGDSPSVGALSNGLKTNNSTPVNGVLSAVPVKADTSFPSPFMSSSSNNQSSVAASMSPTPSSATFKFSDGKPSTSASPVFGAVAAPPLTFSSGLASPSTTVATSASDTTDKSGAKSNANAASGLFDTQSLVAGPTASNKSFLFQAASTPVSASAPSFFGQSASSASTPTSTQTPSFLSQSSFPVSAPAVTPTPSFLGQSASSVSAPASTSSPIFPGLSASSVSAPALTSTSSFTGQFGSSSSVATSSPAPSFPGQSAASPSTFVFGSSGSTGSSSGSVFGSFSANPFSSGSGSGTAPSGLGTSSSFPSSSLSTSSSTTSSIFGFTSESTKPTPTFGVGSTGANASNPFGAITNSSSASNSAAFVFGGNTALPSPTPAVTNSPFQSQPASQPAFSNASSQPFTFGLTPSTNTAQSSMEDTMAEDSSQPSTTPAFGAPPSFGTPPPAFGTPTPTFGTPTPTFGTPTPTFGTPTPTFGAPSGGGFGFNSTPAAANPFQFNTQPSQIPPQNPSFQASGSLEFNGGGNSSFSLGTNDKSQRRIVRVKKTGRRK